MTSQGPTTDSAVRTPGAPFDDLDDELDAIDRAAVERCGALEHQRRRVDELLQKLEREATDASERVVERIADDYRRRLATLDDDLGAVRGDALGAWRRALEILEQRRTDHAAAQDDEDELALRVRIGEFDDTAAAQERLDAAREHTRELEQRLDAARALVDGLRAAAPSLDGLDDDETGRDEPGRDEPGRGETGRGETGPRDLDETAKPTPKPLDTGKMPALTADGSPRSASAAGTQAKSDAAGAAEAGEAGDAERPQPIAEDKLLGATLSISRAQLELGELQTQRDTVVCLVSTDVDDLYYILEPDMTVGRLADAGNQVVIDDLAVSRQHAKIQQEDGRFVLIDLSSANGTFVNERRITSCTLDLGDRVQFGPAGFIVRPLGELFGD